jgi:hypothetical protein
VPIDDPVIGAADLASLLAMKKLLLIVALLGISFLAAKKLRSS